MSSIRWQGLRCKECRRVWHKSCLLKASEDWDMSESDASSGEHYTPNNSSESSDAESESDAESKTPPDVDEDALRVAVAKEPSTYICDSMTAPMQDAKETNADSDEHDGSYGKRQLKSQINYCFICKKPRTKFARHLKRHAHQNADVAKALSLAPSSCERKNILEKLRNLGNFSHNTEVKATGSGALKVKRESKTSNVSEAYDFCTHCKGMFSRRELWKHMKRCLLNSAMTEETSAGRKKGLNMEHLKVYLKSSWH
ncbi:unnamed protein product [Arctogadus glacialis]